MVGKRPPQDQAAKSGVVRSQVVEHGGVRGVSVMRESSDCRCLGRETLEILAVQASKPLYLVCGEAGCEIPP
jgi:hypothetical protein